MLLLGLWRITLNSHVLKLMWRMKLYKLLNKQNMLQKLFKPNIKRQLELISTIYENSLRSEQYFQQIFQTKKTVEQAQDEKRNQTYQFPLVFFPALLSDPWATLSEEYIQPPFEEISSHKLGASWCNPSFVPFYPIKHQNLMLVLIVSAIDWHRF